MSYFQNLSVFLNFSTRFVRRCTHVLSVITRFVNFHKLLNVIIFRTPVIIQETFCVRVPSPKDYLTSPRVVTWSPCKMIEVIDK